MRGHDTQQAGMFSYLSLEERIPVTAPPAAYPAIRGHGSDRVVAPVGAAVCPNRSAFNCPGEAPAGLVAAGTLQSPE
jgi:hypothetical protein